MAEPIEPDPPDRAAHPRHHYQDGDGASRASSQIEPSGRRSRNGGLNVSASVLGRHISRNGDRHPQRTASHYQDEASGIYSTCSGKHITIVEDVDRGRRQDEASGIYSTCSGKHITIVEDVGRGRRSRQNRGPNSSRGPRGKDQHSDVENGGGYVDRRSQVKFADQNFAPRRPSADASVASSAMGSAVDASVASSARSHQSHQSHFTADSSYYSVASSLRHRIRQHGFLKTNALPLAVIAALMLGSIVRYWSWSGGAGAAVLGSARGGAAPQRARAQELSPLMQMMINPNVDGITIQRSPGEGTEGAIHELENELNELENLLQSKNEWEVAAKKVQEGRISV